jgi:hypothetical protein
MKIADCGIAAGLAAVAEIGEGAAAPAIDLLLG